MIRRRPLRRALATAFIGATLAAIAPATPANAAAEVPHRVCDYDWREGTWHIKQLIRCAARRWEAPGSPDQAVAVARCESGLRVRAFNPSGGYAGLYQQATRYWPPRAHHYGQPDRSVYNGRANVIVSIRMAAAANSWAAWGGCA